MANDTPAALLPCPFCGEPDPQSYEEYAGTKQSEWTICCNGSSCDGRVSGDSSGSYESAVRAWNRRASTAPGASESRGSAPDNWDHELADAIVPTPPAVSNGEPPDWAIAQVVRDEMATRIGDGTTYLPWLVCKAIELARSAAAKGEG